MNNDADDQGSRIFHVALEQDWTAARLAGSYRVSTLGVTLETEGFIHASRADQWRGVLARFYADVTEPMVLLEIDPSRLRSPVVDEPPAPGLVETFPHVYGPIDLDAVVGVRPIRRDQPPSPPGG
ncbi:unannotated protein [freshwater metagenome]|uniref:Unannotated protein n=1 Tax=freshwater metagenome TaxID=449393 RepID=A0A6J6NQL9_9ZZZZ